MLTCYRAHVQELEHTSATLAAMDLSDATLTAAKDEFFGQKAGHRRYAAPWEQRANSQWSSDVFLLLGLLRPILNVLAG